MQSDTNKNLFQAAIAITSSLNFKKVIHQSLKQLQFFFPNCFPYIFINSSAKSTLKSFYLTNDQLHLVTSSGKHTLLGIENWVFTTGEPVILNNQPLRSSMPKHFPFPDLNSVHSMAIPLLTYGNRAGVIQLFKPALEQSFSTEDMHTLNELTQLIANALMNANKFERQEIFNKELEKEIKSTTEQLRFANDGLREAERARSESISMVAHELRTPITSIGGFTKLFIDKKLGTVTSEQAEFCEIIKKNTNYIERMIKDLLVLTKLELNKMELHFESINCQSLMKEVMVSFINNDRLIFQPIDASIMIKADKLRIVQVLTNLISNALKYSPTNSPVEVICRTENNQVIFAVEDKGAALSTEQQEKVFDKFYRIKTQDQKSGSGLGLAICKIIINKHNGHIWVTTNQYEGNSFQFKLKKLST